jgi:hypothetical protein
MAKSEPKNEWQLCEAVVEVLANRQGESVVKIEPVDVMVRDRQAVEAIYHTKSTRFATEHTRIESFPNQIALGKQFAQLLGPLEAELARKLPGVFFLIVTVGEARVPVANHAAVRQAVAAWIIEKAVGLDPEEKSGPRGNCKITATPNSVPFEVTLHRDCDYDSGLFIMQRLSGDLEQLRRRSIVRSLENKCPKLKTARNGGCISVLILESDDVSLADQDVVAEAAALELKGRADQPDVVVWARTGTRPWKGALIKDGAKLFPNIDAKLFDL